MSCSAACIKINSIFSGKDSMGIRGELYTNQVNLDNRSYYFNVKENRNGDVFLQLVESKIKDGEDSRRDIVIFADDLQKFFGGMDDALKFIEKTQKERAKLKAEKKAAKEEKFGASGKKDNAEKTAKKIYRRKGESRLVAEKRAAKEGNKPTGRLHVVSKRSAESTEY
jgi:hypothetical protein